MMMKSLQVVGVTREGEEGEGGWRVVGGEKYMYLPYLIRVIGERGGWPNNIYVMCFCFPLDTCHCFLGMLIQVFD